jgi:DNA-directed RNA polymerase specialized sigma24 family protein
MPKSVQTLVRETRAYVPGALEEFLSHSRMKEIARVRACRAKRFPWATLNERRLDCQRFLWEAVVAQKDIRVEQLRTDSAWTAYLSACVRNRLFRQIRTELQLREASVIDNVGRKRFELQPKIVRAPFDLALAQVDVTMDPFLLVARRESILEVSEAVKTASMSLPARHVLHLRLQGTMNKDIARMIGKTAFCVSWLLREARQAVRGQLCRIRAGGLV